MKTVLLLALAALVLVLFQREIDKLNKVQAEVTSRVIVIEKELARVKLERIERGGKR